MSIWNHLRFSERALVAGMVCGLLVIAGGSVLALVGATVFAIIVTVGLATGILVYFHLIVFAKSRQDIRQVRSLISIQALPFKYPVPLESSWAIAPDLANIIVEQLESRRPRVVLECGSGSSTILIASCLKMLGAGTVYSLDHLKPIVERTKAAIDLHGLSERVRLIHAPLTEFTLNGQAWRWYDIQCLPPEVDKIDMIFVDGPPSTIQRFARFPALPLMFNWLAPNVTIILDDGKRRDERATVARWVAAYPEFKAAWLDTQKGTWILRRQTQG